MIQSAPRTSVVSPLIAWSPQSPSLRAQRSNPYGDSAGLLRRLRRLAMTAKKFLARPTIDAEPGFAANRPLTATARPGGNNGSHRPALGYRDAALARHAQGDGGGAGRRRSVRRGP